MVQGKITEADTPTIRLGATPSGLTSAHLHHPLIFLQAWCTSCRPTNSVIALKPTTENSLSPEREESTTVHAASVLPHHLSETIYHDISEMMTLVVNNSLAIW